MLTLVPAWVSSCCARGPLVDLADQPSQGRPLAVAVRHRRSGCKQGPSKKGQNGFRQHGAGSQSIPVVDSATGSQIRGLPSTGNLGKALQGFAVFLTASQSKGSDSIDLPQILLSADENDADSARSATWLFTHRNVWSMAELRTPCRNSNFADGA